MANDERPGKNGGENTADWRDLAQRIEKENNSAKMVELVHQLIDTLDEQKLQKNPPRSAEPRNPGFPDV
jgi:DNA transposition AAA+ family ATPase